MNRSPIGSYSATGSPWFELSHGVPVPAWLQRLSKVNAASWAPVLLKMPTDVLTVSTMSFGPTSLFGSGGQPAPQFVWSRPWKLAPVVGVEAVVPPVCSAGSLATWPWSASPSGDFAFGR